MSAALAFVLLGWVLWWVGYYVAIATAWRAGVRGVGIAVAVALGICGCFGIPILTLHYSKIQLAAFDAIGKGDDAAVAGARLRRYQIGAALAVIGVLMQIVAGALLPDDDSASYEPYDDERYREADEILEPSDPDIDEATVTGERLGDDALAADTLGEDPDEAMVHPEDDPAWEVAPDQGEVEALEAEHLATEAARLETEGGRFQGLVLGLSADRRAAIVIEPYRGRGVWVTRARRAPFADIEPGATIAVDTVMVNGGLVAGSVEATAAPPWEALQRPTVLGVEELSDLEAHIGAWVIVAGATAIDATSIRVAEDAPPLRVRAPAGSIVADRVYTALRGVLVDTRVIDRRGGALELWISRETDVIAE